MSSLTCQFLDDDDDEDHNHDDDVDEHIYIVMS
jgi:hypothetical protein